jgi:ABC-2 type transport system permease protein
VFLQSLLFGFCQFPLNGSLWVMIVAMIMFVVACQALALLVCCLLPNLRLALSVVSLLGVLSFSITGFSFPLENMYGAVAIFSYIIPVRYYFLIYVDQALNGIPLYYSQYYFVALAIFPLLATTMLWRLKKACEKPVYVP